MTINRINYAPGREPSSSFLNRIQDPVILSGEERSDYWSPQELLPSWGINHRDGIKDWEVDSRSSLASISHHGLVYGAVVNERNNTLIALTIGRPRSYVTTSTPLGYAHLTVKAGSIINVEGNVLSWDDTELTLKDGVTSYGWVDSEGTLKTRTTVLGGLPAPTQVFTPLFRATLQNTVLTNFVDLRPGSHLAYHPQNYFVLLNTPITSGDYTARSWERVLVDTTSGSIRVTLPFTPQDADRIGVLDAGGHSRLNPVAIEAGGTTLVENSHSYYYLDSNFGHISLVFSEEKNSWYIESKTEPSSSQSRNIFPVTYKKVSVDYTLTSQDYRTWIDVNCTGVTRVVTLPVEGLEFGFEANLQAKDGTFVLVSEGEVDTDSLQIPYNKSIRVLWLDNTFSGGQGIWKIV